MNDGHKHESFIRKRKMMAVLPLLVLPFITMVFWAMGGGKAKNKKSEVDHLNGLNLQLPQAKLKEDKHLSKLDYYEIAEQDSAKWRKKMRNDPYFKLKGLSQKEDALYDSIDNDLHTNLSDQHSSALDNGHVDAAVSEEQIYRKLKELNSTLENSQVSKAQESADPTSSRFAEPQQNGHMKKEPGAKPSGGYPKQVEKGPVDTEMVQINGMLDKILDIQHPERLEKPTLNHGSSGLTKIYKLSDGKGIAAGFYSIEGAESSIGGYASIEAVIHSDQKLMNGGTVQLRLINNVWLDSIELPAGQFVYGKAILNGERLSISITTIQYHKALLPVSLSVYDLYGMEGIDIPGATTQEAIKQSAGNSIESIGLANFDPSVGAQAASAGIETAKNILSKKLKPVHVNLKAGYKVLLKEKNTKQ